MYDSAILSESVVAGTIAEATKMIKIDLVQKAQVNTSKTPGAANRIIRHFEDAKKSKSRSRAVNTRRRPFRQGQLERTKVIKADPF